MPENETKIETVKPSKSPKLPKSIYLIRHGQSLANIGAKSIPDAKIALTDLGLQQAESLLQSWQRLVNQDQLPIPNQIYQSGLLRAQQTADAFATHFELTPKTEPLLNEMCCLGYSTVEGMVGKQRAPLMQHYWQTADVHYRDAPDADTFDEFMARVDSFIELAPSLEHNSLCFGHGMWIGLLAYRLLGFTVNSSADIQKFRQIQTAMPMYNTVVYRLDISSDGVMQLQVVNELKEL